ncbi:hypothetical protein BT67DRAFT_400352 [Trichocladium antarcticum]|uniref:WD repeat protein n=1 Tax=Trichocladium antarcticum TaxID=1450529 RepID=A0AAN6UNF5_9PEZI|nr:hypothetical protein BT67DRAFT_400352 [Trichocladium antarcticum]
MYSIGNQGKIMRKLLGKPPPDSAHDPAPPTITSSPLAAHYRPTAAQDAIYAAGVPIASIDISSDGQSAVLAGRHVLKTITFDGLKVKEGIDLRALLNAQPATRNNNPTSVADQLSIKAVKWGEPQGKQAIFTACTSGTIFQYDLARVGATSPGAPVDCVQMREDSRQVNALDINPHRNSWLLSGSQDGIVRCFDVRQPIQTRTGPTFRSIQAFKCNADGVRHVQWNPRDGFLFACGTEQGIVLKWDMRKPSAPVLRINAHEKTCTALAWHPDGVHLVSAGLDSKCNIWDMSKQDKRQKPKWTISTPAPAGTLAWRPGQWSATAQGKRTSQLAMSYDESSQKRYGINAVHIWDLARPTMPYKEVQRFDSSPGAMLWRDQYLLWTAGQDGIFSQCDLSFAPKVIDRQAVSTMTFSPRGEVLMLLDERTPSHRVRPHISHHDAVTVPSYSSSPTTPRFSVSRSDSEDDAIGTFIGPKRRGSRRRRTSARSTATLSTTPPAGSGMDEVMSLEQTIKVTGTYRPQQAMAVGHVPAAVNVEVYGYLAVNYLEALYGELPCVQGDRALPDRIATILEHYAKAATNVKQFRLAQTWRILAYAVDMLLQRRAQYHLERRMDRHQNSLRRKSEAKAKAKGKASAELYDRPIEARMGGEETPRRIASMASIDKALRPRSLLSEELLENNSDAATPLARPVPDGSGAARLEESGRGRKLTPIVEPESFTLPPPAHLASLERRKRLDSVPLSLASHGSGATHASTEGYDFYDADAIFKAVDAPTSEPTTTQVLDYGNPGFPGGARTPFLRHDSEDSYVHLFSISDEGRRTTGLASSPDKELAPQAARAAIIAELRRGSENDVQDIRGKQLDRSPDREPAPAHRSLLQRTETDMTAFTDEHHAITQTTTDSFDSQFPSQADSEAFAEPPLKQASLDEGTLTPDYDRSPFIVETDYLCWPDDLPYPYPAHPSSASPVASSSPLQPYSLISRALAFEAKSSALNASAIVLALKPLLPEDVIDNFQAGAILRQHHARLMSMKFFVEAALLRKLCIKGWPGGDLASWGDNYPAIFTTAQQGVQANFFCTGCHKARDVDRTSGSTESLWHCERCEAVMGPCAVCGHRDNAPRPSRPSHHRAPHARRPGPAPHEPVLTTWWFCPGCGHGGHSSCLQSWHAALEPANHCPPHLEDPPGAESSDGCCPLDGCGHACLPGGRWRAESAVATTDEVSRVVREATRAVAKATVAAATAAAIGAGAAADEYHENGGIGWGGGKSSYSASAAAAAASVRSDGYDIVPHSRAVETVREALAGAGAGPDGGGGRVGTGILSSSPGRGIGGERERRKSVKFVGTEERW